MSIKDIFNNKKIKKNAPKPNNKNNKLIEKSLMGFFVELLIQEDNNNELKMALKKYDKQITKDDKPIIYIGFTNSEIQQFLSDWYHSAKLNKEGNLSTEAYNRILSEMTSKYIKEYTPAENLIRQSELLNNKIKEYVEQKKEL